jgi:hypothetical protein
VLLMVETVEMRPMWENLLATETGSMRRRISLYFPMSTPIKISISDLKYS